MKKVCAEASFYQFGSRGVSSLATKDIECGDFRPVEFLNGRKRLQQVKKRLSIG
jgi:hypothetical protein